VGYEIGEKMSRYSDNLFILDMKRAKDNLFMTDGMVLGTIESLLNERSSRVF